MTGHAFNGCLCRCTPASNLHRYSLIRIAWAIRSLLSPPLHCGKSIFYGPSLEPQWTCFQASVMTDTSLTMIVVFTLGDVSIKGRPWKHRKGIGNLLGLLCIKFGYTLMLIRGVHPFDSDGQTNITTIRRVVCGTITSQYISCGRGCMVCIVLMVLVILLSIFELTPASVDAWISMGHQNPFLLLLQLNGN